MNNKKKCFVIMPFSETDSLDEQKWTEIFEHIIKPAVEESGLGYECKRYGLGRANIVKDILEELSGANVVIADLTDDNPNVLWELGVRHVLKRRTTLISQDKKFIPSDLKDYPVIPYDQTKAGFDKFKDDLKKKLEDIEADPDKPDSPVADFLQLKNIDILAYEKAANLRKLSALITELSYNIDVVNRTLNTVKESEERRAKDKKTWTFSNERFNNTCLELLISTLYVLLPEELLNNIISTNGSILAINNRLDLWSQHSYLSGVEEFLKENLPTFKKVLLSLSQKINEIKIQYDNDNYIEPMPTMFVSSTELKDYLKLPK